MNLFKSKNRVLLLACILFVSLLSIKVLAAEETFALSDIVETIQGFNIGEAYNTAPYVIDGILYLILFIGIAQTTLGRRFEGAGGKTVVAAIGIIMAVSLSYWSIQSKFTLGSLGPLAGILLVIIIAAFIFRLIGGNRAVGEGIWMAILVVYIAVYVFFHELTDWLSESTYGRFALGLLNILGIIAIPMMFRKLLRGRGRDYYDSGYGRRREPRGREPEPPEPTPPPTPPGPTPTPPGPTPPGPTPPGGVSDLKKLIARLVRVENKIIPNTRDSTPTFGYHLMAYPLRYQLPNLKKVVDSAMNILTILRNEKAPQTRGFEDLLNQMIKIYNSTLRHWPIVRDRLMGRLGGERSRGGVGIDIRVEAAVEGFLANENTNHNLESIRQRSIHGILILKSALVRFAQLNENMIILAKDYAG